MNDIVLNLLKLGPVPKHVAFIMDGNRRFAQNRGLQVQKGHEEGFSKLEETLDWCIRLGVEVVTVYAFSTENFNRDPEEVRLLMELAKEKFKEFATKSASEVIQKFGISVKVFGNTSLLPEDVRDAASQAVEMTSQYNRATLNICIPYTSREEIALAIRSTVEHMDLAGELDAEILNKWMYSADSPPLDLLVRTSGEIRLSDFMLWQAASSAEIHFIDTLWPDFSIWDVMFALLKYQARESVASFYPLLL
ncbi:cis-prenyltransferase [Irineochytrium annulatum]|nr:cis-prenyltransferase [Irineochytrium annulatum]